MKSLTLLAIALTILLSICATPVHAQVKSADSILKQIKVEGRVSFTESSLPFKFDSTELANRFAEEQLAEIVKALSSPEFAQRRFLLLGHTCDLGKESYNQDLSERRAVAIKRLLAAAGVDGRRLEIDGRGESQPALPNISESNRAMNRRVDLKLLD